MEQIVLNLNLKYVIAGLTAEQKGLLLEALFEGAEKIARADGESGLAAGGESAADMPLPAVLQNQPEAGNAYRFILLQQYEYEAKRRRMRQLGARGAARRKGNAAAKMADLFAAEAGASAGAGGAAGATVESAGSLGSSGGAADTATMVIGGGAARSAVGADSLSGASGLLKEAFVGAAVAENNGVEMCRAAGSGAGAAVTADGSSGVQAALTLKRKEAKENILNKNNILFLGLTEKKKEPAAGLELAADDGTARATGLRLAADDGTCGEPEAAGLGLAADDGTAGVSDAAGASSGLSVPDGSGGGSCKVSGATGSGGSGGGSCGVSGATGSGGDNPGGRLAFFSGRKRRGAHASPVLPQPAFQPPSVAEVQAFVTAENLQLDAGTFVDFYDSHGWCVGKTAIKNWKATARLWHRRAVAEAATRGGKKTEDDEGYWAELENKISRL